MVLVDRKARLIAERCVREEAEDGFQSIHFGLTDRGRDVEADDGHRGRVGEGGERRAGAESASVGTDFAEHLALAIEVAKAQVLLAPQGAASGRREPTAGLERG